MARPGWYNENSGRDFPFVFGRGEGNADYTDFKNSPDIVVDFGCVVGVRGDFIEGTHAVWLHAIRKFGNYVDFEFYSDAPGLQYHKLAFSRRLDDEDYEVEYVQAVLKSETSVSMPADPDPPYCAGDVLWEGFLVTKDLTKLSFLSGEETTFGDPGVLSIEPGLIQNLAGHYMSTLNVFNANRTRAERVTGCRPWCWPDDSYKDYQYFEVATCLAGDIRLAEGYNCTIEEDHFNNRLTIHAEVGQGLGEPCGELLVFPGEQKPGYGNYYDGSVGCDEVIRSVNGIEGPHLEIIGGQGVTVDSIPSQHLVLIKVDMQDLAGCFEQEASTSLSEISPNADPCACGVT